MRNLAHQLCLQEAENQALNQMIVSQVWQQAEIVHKLEGSHIQNTIT
jgi:hypothetical protein